MFIKKPANTKGTSLLELLIYIAVFSSVVVFLANIFPLILRSRTTTNARLEVQENIRFITEKLQQEVWNADSVDLGTQSCPLTQIIVFNGPVRSEYRIFNNVFEYDPDGFFNSLPYQAITSNLVTASVSSGDCLFTKINNPSPAKNTLQVKLKVSYNDQGRPDLQYSETVQFTVSLR